MPETVTNCPYDWPHYKNFLGFKLIIYNIRLVRQCHRSINMSVSIIKGSKIFLEQVVCEVSDKQQGPMTKGYRHFS